MIGKKTNKEIIEEYLNSEEFGYDTSREKHPNILPWEYVERAQRSGNGMNPERKAYINNTVWLPKTQALLQDLADDRMRSQITARIFSTSSTKIRGSSSTPS